MKKSKKKKTIGDLIWRVVFLAALVVFCYCAFQLITIYLEYKKGTDEYSSLEQKYVSEDMFTENETGGAAGGENSGETDKNGAPVSSQTDASGAENDSEGETAKDKTDLEKEPYTTGETETEIETDEKGQTTVRSYLVLKNPVDFESLQKVNEDIIGWIRVSALGISYPIAQSTDNDYYLHRTFERVDNFAGCIFMEYQNHSDFSHKNTII